MPYTSLRRRKKRQTIFSTVAQATRLGNATHASEKKRDCIRHQSPPRLLPHKTQLIVTQQDFPNQIQS